jgi:large subunit ribosomal protein L6
MSRIGKNPVAVPAGVTVSVAGNVVTAKGKAGEAKAVLNDNVKVTVEGNVVKVAPASDSQQARMMWGTGRALVAKIVKGAAEGYTKNLELSGVGYKAALQGSELVLNLGFSHDIRYKVPAGIKIATPKPTEISISGADAQQVGQVAAEIRAMKRPEPYKGKGVMYVGEKIRRKEGKKK